MMSQLYHHLLKFASIGLLGILATLVYSSSVHAQALPAETHNLTDVSEIACTLQLDANAKGDSALFDACKRGYMQQANKTWCDDQSDFSAAQKNACKKGASESNPPDRLYCGSKFSPPAAGQLYGTNNEYYACGGGFKMGEAYCTQNYSSQQHLLDACKKGSEGQADFTQARGSNQTSGQATTSPPAPVLGKAPSGSNITNILAEREDVQSRQTCALEGVIGSMMCGGIGITADMADASLAVLGSFMRVDALTTQADNPVYTYWQTFRTIANVLFIIALLAIVISHITSFGLSTYNVTKMMPRLIVGAVLLNMSYLVCTVVVDISNVLGATVYGTMQDLVAPSSRQSAQTPDRLQTPMTANPLIDPATNEPETFGSAANAIAFAHSVSVIRGGKGALGAGINASKFAGKAMNSALSALLPIIVAVLLGIVITVVCLLLRQALIIGFIIISPLAVAAFLLPNTKPLFDRWLKSFVPLVMLFPVIAFTFGMGAIAAQIIGAGAFANTNFAVRSLLILLALSVQIIPLLAVPKLMALGGGLLAQLSNMGASQTAGLNSKAKQYAKKQKDIKDDLSLADPRWYNKHRRMRAESRIKDKDLEAALEETQERSSKASRIAYGGIPEGPAPDSSNPQDTPEPSDPTSESPAADTVDPPTTVPTATANPEQEASAEEGDENENTSTDSIPTPPSDPAPEAESIDNGLTQKVYAQAKGRAKLVEARAEQFEAQVTPGKTLENIALGVEPGTTAVDQEAAILRIAKNKDIGGLLTLVKNSSSMSRQARNTLADAMLDSNFSGGAPMFANQESQDNLRRGVVNGENFNSTFVAPSLRNDDYSPQAITEIDDEVGKNINATIANPAQNGLNDTHIADIRNAARLALTNETTRRKVGKQLTTVTEMAGMQTGERS